MPLGKMNIIMFIVDALRPDHLSANGYARATSPNMDRLAKEGTSFSNAYCPFPWTNSSILSAFTGVYPHNHGVRLVSNNKFNESVTTLPEILKSHGFRNAYLDVDVLSEPAMKKGFQEFNPLRWKIENKIKRSIYKIFNPKNFLGLTEQHTGIAIRWIKKHSGDKFFLCHHPIDLHWPYWPPKPYDHMFDSGYKGSHDFNTLAGGKLARGDVLFGHVKFQKEEMEHAIAHYDGAIKYVDTQIGRILDTLKEIGLEDETLVILTSDHGENFGEHDFYFQHAASLYEPSIRIPLIFKHPRLVPKGKIIKQRVQNIDIMPTIMDMLNVPLIDRIDGISLLPLLKGETLKCREFIFAESLEEHFKGHKRIFFPGIKGKWRTMIIGDWKIIYIPHPQNDIFELYNLKDDPDEKNNLISKEKEIASEMKKRILEFLKQQSNEGDADLSSMDDKSKKLLRELGYME